MELFFVGHHRSAVRLPLFFSRLTMRAMFTGTDFINIGRAKL
jgi:hypothetical protein